MVSHDIYVFKVNFYCSFLSIECRVSKMQAREAHQSHATSVEDMNSMIYSSRPPDFLIICYIIERRILL